MNNSDKCLLPQADLNEILDNYSKDRRPLETEAMLRELRKEWKFSHQVYGNRVARAGSPAKKREAVQALGARMFFLKQLGTFLKSRINMDGQGELFPKPDNSPE